MWQVLKDIITSPFGSFAFVAGILYLTHWVVHYLTKNVQMWSDTVEKVKTIEDNIETVKNDLAYIKAALSLIQNNGGLTQSHSPIGLSKLGETVAEKMGISTIIGNNWENILNLIDKQGLRNAYDVQQFCIETATINIDNFFLPEDVATIKNYAYNEGRPLAYYGSMIGVLIRDKYFQVKGIDPTEVDKHDPNLK